MNSAKPRIGVLLISREWFGLCPETESTLQVVLRRLGARKAYDDCYGPYILILLAPGKVPQITGTTLSLLHIDLTDKLVHAHALLPKDGGGRIELGFFTGGLIFDGPAQRIWDLLTEAARPHLQGHQVSMIDKGSTPSFLVSYLPKPAEVE